MIKKLIIRFVLKDIYKFLQFYSNSYEAALYNSDCDECQSEDCYFCESISESLTTINNAFSWLNDYEIKCGIKDYGCEVHND